jgi:membrane protein YdbS with pleckstrin-like domain
MLQLLQFVATLSAALFAGAALYINVAEHPARMRGDISSALTQWAISYSRAKLLQAPLAIVASLASLAAWLFRAGTWWLIAGILIGAVVPFTLLVIMPTNQKLLATQREAVSSETQALLERWGRLHAVRTVLSLSATILMLSQFCPA